MLAGSQIDDIARPQIGHPPTRRRTGLRHGQVRVIFHQTFETVESMETYVGAPPDVIEAARMLLATVTIDTATATVKEHVVFCVGCNKLPLCANVDGGGEKTLFGQSDAERIDFSKNVRTVVC